jgi:membrane-associated phospholipid phosphatase
MGKSEKKGGVYISTLIVAITFFVCMGFARIYQGVHSLDQVLYGYQLGIWGALYFYYCLRDFIIHHVDVTLKERLESK